MSGSLPSSCQIVNLIVPVGSPTRPVWRIRSERASHSWTILTWTDATPGFSSATLTTDGRSGLSVSIGVTVVPEWTLRFGAFRNASTTADSIRYHRPCSRRGAPAFAQTTNRIAPDASAMIPVWAMDGLFGAERPTTLPSIVTHSSGTSSAIAWRSDSTAPASP